MTPQTTTPPGRNRTASAATCLKESVAMPSMHAPTDTSTTDALRTAAATIAAIAERADDLPRRQRLAAIGAVADFLADLRAAGVLR